jgi:GTP-binding protein
MLNFFLVNENSESVYFVDLPGYGYAKVAKSERDTWGPMVEGYLAGRPELKLTLMLVDCRIPPTESDRTMKEWLDHHSIPNAVVLTKTDKLSKNELSKALRTSAQILKTKETIAFSAVTGFGKDTILKRIREAIA